MRAWRGRAVRRRIHAPALCFRERNDDNIKDFLLCYDAFVPLWKIASVLRRMLEAYEQEEHRAQLRQLASRLFETRCRDDLGMEGAQELLEIMGSHTAPAPTPRHLVLVKTVRGRRAAEPIRCEIMLGMELAP